MSARNAIVIAIILAGIFLLVVLQRKPASLPSLEVQTGRARAIMQPASKETWSVSNNVASAKSSMVVACYFHGTIRCETCLKIEQVAKATIEENFKAEIASQRLVWSSVNYDLPENAHFLTDFKLPCPSLVLVRQTASGVEAWKLLHDTWQLEHAPSKLSAYVESEVRSFLTATNSSTPPPPPMRPQM